MPLALGQLATFIALVMSGLATGAFVLAAVRRDELSARVARDALAASAGTVLAALAALFVAFGTNDFRFEAVAHYSDASLSTAYRLSALWAGAEGSLLLWTAMMALASAVVVASRPMTIAMAASGAAAGGFLTIFLVLLNTASSPFTPAWPVPLDGLGLKLSLQTWAMVAHPPILFAGYALLGAPAAMAIGNLVTGRLHEGLTAMRRFLLLGWAMLTAGIALGAWWAYMDLGWGGYWAWDPVENASLVPWLIATAALHTLAPARRSGRLIRTSLALTIAAFLGCVLATYITRGGVVQSLHAYAHSPLTSTYIVLVAAVAVLTVVLVAVRRRRRSSEAFRRDVTARRRSATLSVAAMLLAAFAVAILIATVGPQILSELSGRKFAMSLGSFNRLGAVFGLLIGLWLAIVTVGQRWRGWTTSVGAIIAGAIGAAAAILFNWRFALPRTIWVPVTAIIVAEAAYGVLLTALAARRSGRGWTAVGAHLGLLMILAGVAGSSIVTEDRTALLSPGQTVDFAGRNVRLDTIGPEMASGGSVMTARAELTIATPGGKSYTMRPARRFSMQTEEQMPEVAVRSRPLDDFYIAVNAYEARTGRVSLTLHRAALVMWLWVGSALVSLAGLAAGLARSRQKEMPLP